MSEVPLIIKSPLCKICNSFEQEVLEEITIDLAIGRRNWDEIVEHYSQFLPKGVPKLNHVNLRNHKKHYNLKAPVEKFLKERGEPCTPGEALTYAYSDLYAEEFLKELNRKRLLTELYRKRIKNLHVLQKQLDKKYAELDLLEKQREEGYLQTTDEQQRRTSLLSDIKPLIKQIDDVMGDIQDILVRELNMDKGLSNTTQNIHINFINNVQVHMQNFLQEIVPYVLTEAFKDDKEKGKVFLKYLSDTMDKHLGPALDETNLLAKGK
ncbi:MAG: hypothetical protein M0R03_19840 [Novosphingobium sp.]|nr:hypothetical protein [Novosphingobium sp.]